MLTTIAFQTGRKFIISSTLKHSRKPRATCIRGSVPARCFREKYRQRRGIIPLWSLSPWPSPYRFLPDGVSRYSLFAASTPSPTHPTAPAACLPSLVHPRSPFFVTLASNPPPPEAFFFSSFSATHRVLRPPTISLARVFLHHRERTLSEGTCPLENGRLYGGYRYSGSSHLSHENVTVRGMMKGVFERAWSFEAVRCSGWRKVFEHLSLDRGFLCELVFLRI